MKKLILSFLVLFSASISFGADVLPTDLFGQPFQKIRFKKSIIVPFSLMTPKQRHTIDHAENDLDREFILVFVGGKIVRVGSPLDFDLEKQSEGLDYRKAFEYAVPSGIISSANSDFINVNYCSAYAFLDGLKTSRGYIFTVRREAYPDVTRVKASVGVNFSQMITATYNLFVDLSESERPNPITIRGPSRDLPRITCMRHSHANQQTRVQDFVEAIGADKVEVFQ